MHAVPRVAVVAAAAAVIAGCGHGPPQSPSPSPSHHAGPAVSSPYYQQGYHSGTSGFARNDYGDGEHNTGADVAEMEHDACAGAIDNENNYETLLQPAAQDAYMTGCLNAFGDHPPAAKP